MDPKNAIEILNVTKSFKIEVEDPDKKGTLLNRNPKKTVVNTVLDDISLDIHKGDVLGVLGRNGSGKSTFLSIIARIMEPDSGTVERAGKIASILELGMGFHPDMSGRENIYLKGELYGFSRSEMDSKVEKIIDYSGIQKYIDNPVRTYSSGMSGRLAFAIMINVESDIMLVDEILSVGDATFTTKAKEHFKKLAKSGKTVVFVSHSINDMAEMCNRCIWIENGKIIKDGNAKTVCAEYQNKMSSSPEIISDLAEAGVAESQYQLAMLYRDGNSKFGKSEELYKEWMKRASDQGHTLAQVAYADIQLQENSLSEAMLLLQSAANKGNSEAKSKFASLQSQIPQELCNRIREIFISMAETGNPLYQYRCADYLLKNAWTEDNKQEAFRWFFKSAEQNYSPALYQLAIMYRDGLGVAKNYLSMEKSLIKGSSANDINSIVLLAESYLFGKILPKNEETSFKLYLKGASLGSSKCQYQVARMYSEGIGTEINLEESKKWFEQYTISLMTWHYQWAADWAKNKREYTDELVQQIYLKSAQSGNAISVFSLINMLISNSKNNEKLEELLNLSEIFADSGNISILRNLGNYYEEGIGVEKNYEKAIHFFECSASQGDVWSIHRLGEIYRETGNFEKSKQYFTRGIEEGFLPSIIAAIDLYQTGKCDVSSVNCAINKLNLLAERGNSEAMIHLGNLYYSGTILKKDYSMALRLYEKASKYNKKGVNKRLSEMYLYGIGTDVDLDKAFYYFVS